MIIMVKSYTILLRDTRKLMMIVATVVQELYPSSSLGMDTCITCAAIAGAIIVPAINAVAQNQHTAGGH